jgi:crossover junction endodeoxyribonuclease RuvC
VVVLGIDPGTASLGWGIIKRTEEVAYKVEAYGCIKTDKSNLFSRRLEEIHRELSKIIKKYEPDIAAVEQLFFAKNVKTAISVGEARGVAILAAVQANLAVAEYTPLQVKQSLVGYGRAEKKQMQKMLKVLLGLEDIPKPDDAADALAIALCHLNSERMGKVGKRE